MTLNSRASVFMLLSTFTLALNSFIAKLLTDYFSTSEVVFLRVFLPAIIMLALAAGIKWQLPNKSAWRTFAIRAIFIVLCQNCFLVALNTLTLVEAVILFSTGPLFIPLIERVLFKTKLNWLLLPTMALMFAGVIIQNIHSDGIQWRWSLLIGLGAGVFNACSQITLFRASKINLPMMVINGWSFTLAAIFMVPVLMFSSGEASFYQGFAIDMSDYSLLLMVALIGFSTAATQFFRGKAYRLASSNSQLAPLIYSNLLFALLFQLIFYDTTLSLSQEIGSALIVLACIINTFAPNWLLQRQAKIREKKCAKKLSYL